MKRTTLTVATMATVLTASALATALAIPAFAHVGVDLHGATPTAGSSTALWLRPGHGCMGDATNAVTVTVPDGVTNVKAQPKPGWDLVSDGKTITWFHGTLPDDQFDDFGIRLTWPKLPAGVTSQTFFFPTVQTCNAELKVARSGAKATVTGYLPALAGKKVALFVNDVPLTKFDVVIGADGKFAVATTAAKVPDGANVTAKLNGRMVGNSMADREAWVDVPVPGGPTTLANPAPSVKVVAPAPAAS